jgi:integrase
MNKRFKFTDARIKALPANPSNASSTDLEFSDFSTDGSAVSGLKCLVGKTGNRRFLFRFVLDGKKFSIGTGKFPEINVSAARKAAREYRAMLADGINPKTAADAFNLQPTVSEFFWNTYLPLQKKHKKSWNHDVQRFRKHLEPRFGWMKYRNLKAAHVQQLQLELNSPTHNRPALADATCNRIIALLKTMGQIAIRLNILDTNEAMKIRLLRENNVRTRFLEVDELKAVIREARRYPNPFIGGYIALLAITGCRRSEIRLAKHSDLDIENRTLFIRMTKSGKSRVVYLTDLALDIIKQTPKGAGNPYLFPGRIEGQPIKDCRASLQKILQSANVSNRHEVTLHIFRHTVATHLLSQNYSLSLVQELLAHESIVSTQRYAKLTVQRQRDTSEALSKLVS